MLRAHPWLLLCALARCMHALQLGVDDCAPAVCALHPRRSVSRADYHRVFVAFNDRFYYDVEPVTRI